MSRVRTLFILVPISLFCLVSLGGIWAYSGTPFPSTTGASSAEAFVMWTLSGAQVVIPIVTVILATIEMTTRKRQR
jgi:hypothetical protein